METTESSKIKSAVEKRLLNRLASPGRRYFGQLIDFIVTWIVFIIVLSTLNAVGSPRDQTDVISIVVALSYLFLSDALFILSKSRQRLGDMAAHTIVVKV